MRAKVPCLGKTSDRKDRNASRTRADLRPEQILEAALREFSQHGYAAARIDDVARRAKIAKGTVYLYFKSKRELFQAVIRHVIRPGLDTIQEFVNEFEGPSEQLLEVMLEQMYRAVRNPRIREVERLMIAESAKFPQLAEYYYHEVVKRGLNMARLVVERGVARGEFHATAMAVYPQAIIGPAAMIVTWNLLFGKRRPIPLEEYRRAHLDLILHGLKVRETAEPETFANVAEEEYSPA